MEALREGIGLRGYGQKDPKQEYKKEGFVVFGEMMGNINRNVCEKLFHVQIRREEPAVASTAATGGGTGGGTGGVGSLPAARKPRRMVESGGGTQPAAAASGR